MIMILTWILSTSSFFMILFTPDFSRDGKDPSEILLESFSGEEGYVQIPISQVE